MESTDRAPILLATRSWGKRRELTEILADFDFEVVDLDAAEIAYDEAEDKIEIYATFEENALAKARHFHNLSGMPTIADDSGLVVDALDGAPGVLSKRFSGRNDELDGWDLDIANNAKLLRELERVDRERASRGDGPALRSARYMCVAAYVGSAGELYRTGSIEGRVVETPRGTGGFGYDAHVEVPELGGTMAEADWRLKSRVSHRGRAFRALLPALREIGWA